MIGVARTWATLRLDCDICGLLRRAEHRIAGYAYHPRTEYYAKAQLRTLVLRQELGQPPDVHTGAGLTARLLQTVAAVWGRASVESRYACTGSKIPRGT
jgi:hypothetical protein